MFPRLIFVLLFLTYLFPAVHAQDLRLSEGWWRVELQGAGGTFSGVDDRDGDFYFTGNVEYEFPAWPHVTFGLRLTPLLVYFEDEGEDGDSHAIYGTAAGISARYYFEQSSYRKWYAEGAFAPLWHSRRFEGNSSKVNTWSELGFGYRFPDTPWSMALKFSHISNANLSHDNSAVNAFLLAIGYSF